MRVEITVVFSHFSSSGGGIQFETKTLNCEKSGGIAAIIYNNATGNFDGGLSNPTTTTIPAIEASAADGQNLLANQLGQTLSINMTKGYKFLSGTSMAAPHVAGVAAKIWRAVSSPVSMHKSSTEFISLLVFCFYIYCIQCPLCSNQNVETCLLSTATDLGDTGRDVYYGYGLIQANDAYLCLLNTVQCCGNGGGSLSSAVVASSLKSLSRSPSSSPTIVSNDVKEKEQAMIDVSPCALLLVSSEVNAFAFSSVIHFPLVDVFLGSFEIQFHGGIVKLKQSAEQSGESRRRKRHV